MTVLRARLHVAARRRVQNLSGALARLAAAMMRAENADVYIRANDERLGL